ncbi:tail fiber domain-containing protein [Pseudomonas sp. JQ170]|uniref:tail fiber domain-containing protein n=1 Tax=unclassified Pseudomonas TaxID=196821 RepID=UPI0026504E0D|nr:MULTISPECIES: tail fiber domain-containing protein [unclassified Pseudomonas]MDN7144278.1 tail fiber domain-containing protein [Pseudomonas sp. JQ170]WRO74176.1 tail fiber domain-containing protein [Pseudomonas sp. 170C]WRO77763.1 tail fiber domain-containing protein [Pseudomonas sp. 170C]
MSKQVINLGAAPSGAGGDDRRSAWLKAKSNFTELYNWLANTSNTDDQTTALPTTLPLARGGTGGTSEATARNGLGLGEASTPTFRGLELVNTLPFIDFHHANSASDYTTRLATFSSNLLTCSSRFSPTGVSCKSGESAAASANCFNISFGSGTCDLWVDITRLGSLQVTASDYRIKKNIETVENVSFLDRVEGYRIVHYEIGNFDVWQGDGTVFQGVIAHEAQAVNPLAVSGEKDAVDENGRPWIQQLNHMAFITDLIGAVKELRAEVATLKTELETLKG